MVRRMLSSTARLYTAVSMPAPVHREAVLGTQELQSLSKKAQSSWTELTKDEQVTCKGSNLFTMLFYLPLLPLYHILYM